MSRGVLWVPRFLLLAKRERALPVELRKVRDGEEAAVFDLMRAATRAGCLAACGKPTIDIWTAPENSVFIFRRDPSNFGLFDRGRLVAYSSWQPQRGQGDWARITAAFVQPDRLGQGLGAKVLGRAEADIVAEGYDKIQLWATTNAIPFYQHMGYASASSRMLAVSPHHYITITRMEKRL